MCDDDEEEVEDAEMIQARRDAKVDRDIEEAQLRKAGVIE